MTDYEYLSWKHPHTDMLWVIFVMSNMSVLDAIHHAGQDSLPQELVHFYLNKKGSWCVAIRCFKVSLCPKCYNHGWWKDNGYSPGASPSCVCPRHQLAQASGGRSFPELSEWGSSPLPLPRLITVAYQFSVTVKYITITNITLCISYLCLILNWFLFNIDRLSSVTLDSSSFFSRKWWTWVIITQCV